MGKRSGIIGLAIVLLTATAALARHDDDRQRTIQCESEGGRSHYCPTGTTGRVELAKQLSRTECREYDTWGSDDDGGGIWVRDGCRGIFVVRERGWGWGRRDRDDRRDDDRDGDDRWGRDRDRDDRDDDYAERTIVRCGSDNWAYNHCEVRARRWTSRLVRQHSGTRCVRDSNWGEDRDGIWVDRGCDAEFEIRRR